MATRPVLVTGASGFIGSRLVSALRQRGERVRLGLRDTSAVSACSGVEVVGLDLTAPETIGPAVRGVGTLFHFAALVDSKAPLDCLREVNVAGTRRLWEAAAIAGVDRLVYCSSTAVYGLAAGRGEPITERQLPRALEPYGRTKLEGERAALGVATATGAATTRQAVTRAATTRAATTRAATIIIRPAAVFGRGDHTAIGATLRRVAVSRIVLPGSSGDWAFSYVHVDDVVGAAIHLAGCPDAAGQTFNVAVEPPVNFGEAFAAYRRALRRLGARRWRERALAAISAGAHGAGRLTRRLGAPLQRRYAHSLWRPGWDLTYSSAQLRTTGFRFTRTDFCDVLEECLSRDGENVVK